MQQVRRTYKRRDSVPTLLWNRSGSEKTILTRPSVFYFLFSIQTTFAKRPPAPTTVVTRANRPTNVRRCFGTPRTRRSAGFADGLRWCAARFPETPPARGRRKVSRSLENSVAPARSVWCWHLSRSVFPNLFLPNNNFFQKINILFFNKLFN